jgi:hypothetical protein
MLIVAAFVQTLIGTPVWLLLGGRPRFMTCTPGDRTF